MDKTLRKIILAGMLGNVLEGYDFAVYTILSPVLATLFFPIKDSFISLLLIFSILALSFLVRPLGGILFGYLGDQFGRKTALISSISLMFSSTFLLGLLPGYAAIGIAAPVLLTLFRLIQGIAISGELATAMTYLVEHAHNNGRGFIGSLVMCSSTAGTLLTSALVAILIESVTNQQLLSWGWRLPFLFGGFAGLFSLFMRLRFNEPLLYQTAKKSLERNMKLSIFEHFRQLQYKTISTAILLTCIMAMGYNSLVGYLNAFLTKTMGHTIKSVMFINFICLLTLTCFLPVAGILSDKLGRKPILMFGIISLILLIHPIFWLLQQKMIFLIFLGELLFVIALAPIIAIIPSILAEMFHVHTRNSSIALGYNLSQALFGGTAPLIAIALTRTTQNLYAPAWYLLAGAGISFLTLLIVNESYQQPLQ